MNYEQVILIGRRLARERGGMRDAEPHHCVWFLIVEAFDTLRRLPDREAGWLHSGERAIWPECVREYASAWDPDDEAWGETRLQEPPPSAAQIDRMHDVLTWLNEDFMGGTKPDRDQRAITAKAHGFDVRDIRRKLKAKGYKVAERTVHDIVYRSCVRIAQRLRQLEEMAA